MAPDKQGRPDPSSDAGSDARPSVDLARALEEERRKARLIAAFFDDAARAAANDRSVWQAMVARASEAVGDSAVATLVSEDGEWLEAVGVYHPDPAMESQIWAAVARRRLDGSIYGDVIRKGSVVFIPAFRPEDAEENLKQMSEEQLRVVSQSGVRSIIALPLLLSGRVAGVLASSRTVTMEPYTEADVEVLRALAARAAVVLDNASIHRDLRAASARLETIITESPIATVVLDAGDRVSIWNAASEDLLGWSAKEVTGRPLPDLWLDPETDELALRGRRVPGETIRGMEMRLRTKDGDEIPVALYAAPLREAGEISGRVLRWVDLSERQHLEGQLLQAQRLESVGRLAGGVAHDFNNILTAILGFAELIDEDLPAGDPRRGNVAAIQDAAHRATTLVKQLLAFGRRQVLRPESLNLAEVVSHLAPMLQRLIGEDVKVAYPVGGDLWAIEADRTQLEQVIVNLAVNARDAMPLGGQFTIEADNVDLDASYAETHPEIAPGPYVLLAVSDTGAGMDPVTQSKIFEPFFTTKEAGRGTGLGLATVYGIVRQSGGHIWVYSEPGRGTTFRMYFPRTRRAKEVPSVAAPGIDVLTGTETILVAEDEEMLRTLVELILKRLGYTVLLAADSASALDIINSRPIDLLISDVVMPGQSGLELARAAREVRPELPVLFMSGYTSAALEPHGLSSGDELLQKPFTPDGLARTLRRMLATGRS